METGGSESGAQPTSTQRILRKRWVWALVITAAVFVLVLIVLPYGIGYTIKRWLVQQGADEAVVQDIDFNPFTGYFAVENLRVVLADGAVLSIPEANLDFGWTQLLQKHVVVERVLVQDTVVSIAQVEDARWQFGGVYVDTAKGKKEPVAEETKPLTWGFGVKELVIGNTRLEFSGLNVDSKLHVDKATLTSLETYAADRAARLDFEGTLNDARITLGLDLRPFASERSAQGQVKVSGFTFAPFRPLAGPDLTLLEGKLDLESELAVSYGDETGLQVSHRGPVSLSEVRVQSAEFEVADQSLHWEGQLQLALPAGAGVQLQTEGRVEAAKLAAKLPKQGWHLTNEDLSWQGRMSYRGSDDAAQPLVEGEFTLRGARIDAPEQALSLATLESLDVQGVAVHGTQEVKVGELQVGKLQLGSHLDKQSPDAGASLLHTGGLTLRDLQLSGQTQIGVGAIEIQDAQANMTRDANGWAILDDILALFAANASPDEGEAATEAGKHPAPKAATAPPVVQIARLQIDGKSWVRLEDARATPATAVNLVQLGSLAVDGLQANGGDTIAVGQVQLKALELAQPLQAKAVGEASSARPVLHSDALTVQGVKAALPSEVSVKSVAINDVQASLTRDADGWAVIDDVVAMFAGAESTGDAQAPAAEANAAPPLVRVDQVRVEGDSWVRLDDIRATPSTQVNLVRLDSLSVDALRAKGGDEVNIASVQASALRLGEPLGGPPADLEAQDKKKGAKTAAGPQPLLDSGALTVAEIAVAPASEIGLESVQLKDAKVNVTRLKDGGLAVLDDILAAFASDQTEGQAETAAAKPESAEPGPAVRLGRAEIVGDSVIRFTDETVEPPYEALPLQVDEAHLSDLDSAKPAQPSPLVFKATFGEYGKVTVEGTVQPFTERLTTDLDGNLDNVTLPHLSAYTAAIMGYNMKSGQLDADLDVKINNGKLESQNTLAINNLEVKALDTEERKAFDAQLSIPLESALSVMRDSKGNIELELPISGDIDDPKFGIGDALNKALGKAVSAAAVTYLAYAFQPYGALIAVGKYALQKGQAGGGIRLDPVIFEPGDAQLDDKDLDYLERLVKILNDRPGLRVKVCGRAVPDDSRVLGQQKAAPPAAQTEKPAKEEKTAAAPPPAAPTPVTDDDLKALAQQRGEAVKRHVVKERGIDAGRVFLCQPEIDKEAENKPRVELVI